MSQKHQQQQQTAKKPKPTIPLMELLSINSDIPARKLLRKYGKPDATSYKDLENKLEDLYKGASDKTALEREFAEIHPHKEFILKYLTPEPVAVKTKIIIPENESSLEGPVETITTPSKEPLKPNHEFLISAVAIVAIVGLVIYSTK